MSDVITSTTRSAKLNAPTRSTLNDRIPFFFGFIPSPYQTGIQSDNGFTQLSGLNAQGPDGLAVASGGFIDIPLHVPRDMPFYLENIQITAWNPAVEGRGASIGIGSRSILAAPHTLYQGGSTAFTAQAGQNVIYVSFLSASVYLGSGGSRDLYGGTELHPQTRQAVEVPLQVQSSQSDMNGPTRMKVEALLGQNTVISVRIYNNYTGTLRVNGLAFGYKIPAAVG